MFTSIRMGEWPENVRFQLSCELVWLEQDLCLSRVELVSEFWLGLLGKPL